MHLPVARDYNDLCIRTLFFYPPENLNPIHARHLDGYDILVAMNGMTALEIARHEKLDLILLDIMMPEMDGYEICHRLKEMPETADIPVIFITSKTDEESIERAVITSYSIHYTKLYDLDLMTHSSDPAMSVSL